MCRLLARVKLPKPIPSFLSLSSHGMRHSNKASPLSLRLSGLALLGHWQDFGLNGYIICYSSQLFMIHRTYQFISHQIKQKQTASVPFTIAAVSVICVYIYIYRIEHIHTVYIHIPHASTCHNHLNSLLRQVTSA